MTTTELAVESVAINAHRAGGERGVVDGLAQVQDLQLLVIGAEVGGEDGLLVALGVEHEVIGEAGARIGHDGAGVGVGQGQVDGRVLAAGVGDGGGAGVIERRVGEVRDAVVQGDPIQRGAAADGGGGGDVDAAVVDGDGVGAAAVRKRVRVVAVVGGGRRSVGGQRVEAGVAVLVDGRDHPVMGRVRGQAVALTGSCQVLRSFRPV